MSGAWELGRNNVLVATLTRELVATKWAVGYRNMQLPGNSVATILSGMPFDCARNTACQNMLDNNFTWLFFLDDDVVCPPDTIQRLINHGKDIVSALYYRRAAPIVPCAMTVDAKGQAQWVTSWNPPNSTIEVDYVGAGALLIHRRVLETVKKPWFEWQIGKEEPPNPCKRCGAEAVPQECPKAPGQPHEPTREISQKLSEDYAFCKKAKKEFGFKIHLDTSIVCEHIGLGESMHGGNFRPSHV